MKYKSSIVILFFSVLATTNAWWQTKVPAADVLVKQGMTEAAKTHKNVFIIFHASWCGWCHKMEDAMNDGELKSFFDNNYATIHLTVDENKDKLYLGNPGADELRKRYHGDRQGIPYWFIPDDKGNFLADSLRPDNHDAGKLRSVGCPAEKDEVDYFAKVLKKTSLLNEQQLALIEKRFFKNKD